MRKNKALFLDRDGVINKLVDNRPPWKVSEISIYDGIQEIIEYSINQNFIPILITNQPDAGRGQISYELLYKINRKICNEVNLEKFYVCDHPYDGLCNCRKPKPGMLLKASEENNINLKKSFMIGDRDKDILAGKRAGCTTISLSKIDIGADFHAVSHFQLLNLLKKKL